MIMGSELSSCFSFSWFTFILGIFIFLSELLSFFNFVEHIEI
jgi:hypothetical protein